jgi:hypothetical protein
VIVAGVPPIALADWEDGETLVAVADGACRLVRPEPPVPVEQLIFRGVSAGVELGGDGVILWKPRPGGRKCGFINDTTDVARVPAGAGHMVMSRREVVVQLDDELVAHLDELARRRGVSR